MEPLWPEGGKPESYPTAKEGQASLVPESQAEVELKALAWCSCVDEDEDNR